MLPDGPVRREALVDIFVVDFTKPYGSRLPRFKNDYCDMVAPKITGMPNWEKQRYEALHAFADEGAYLDDTGEVVLPEVVMSEFRANARALGLAPP